MLQGGPADKGLGPSVRLARETAKWITPEYAVARAPFLMCRNGCVKGIPISSSWSQAISMPPPTTFTIAGPEEGLHRFVSGRFSGITADRRSRAGRKFYFSISEAQFNMIDKEAAFVSSILVLMRNF
jgi:hypothetical protein